MNDSFTLAMQFTTNLGKTYALSVGDADPAVTAQEVRDSMDAIVAAGIFESVNGRPNGNKSAVLSRREAVDIDVS